MPRLFGTDGVRGIANAELTCELAYKLGQAAAYVLAKAGVDGKKPLILIGKDTRMSSDMLEAALTAGICSAGSDVMYLGVIPTPAVAYLVKKYKASAGAVISASHNPMEHNGIKFFSSNGFKLPDAVEDEIEKLIADGVCPAESISGAKVGRKLECEDPVNDYIKSIVPAAENCDFSNLQIVADCSNGAASATFEQLVKELKIENYVIIHAKPDGKNINEKCGSTHLEGLIKAVGENSVQGKTTVGLAFDGDADRFLAVDENGSIVDGDKLILIYADYFKKTGKLANDTVVVTTMTNMGFFKAAETLGIKTIAANVGDRYVLEKMTEGAHALGGEQSGHIIMSEYSTTGDGQLAAAMLLKIMSATKKTLSQLASIMTVYPQILIGVQADNEKKQKIMESSQLKKRIEEYEKQLSNEGRILIRASGTEPLIRIMAEGKNEAQIKEIVYALKDYIETI